ncbi:MAG: class II fructose-bisphosphate aldolase [Actinomycetota bacterium]
MLVNYNYLLKDAFERDYGVGAIEVWDSYTIKAAVDCAREENSPSALLAGQPFVESLGIESFANLAVTQINSVEVPIALCLDECTDFDFIINCIKAGFSFVMFDGGGGEHIGEQKISFEENVKISREVAKVSHAAGVTVEASLGQMPLATGGHYREEERKGLTDPKQALEFVSSTGIDILAPSIGNIHCLYRESWPEPDWELGERIVDKIRIPCALHGASGATDDQIRRAISIGFRKINMGTRFNEIYREALTEEIKKCEGLGCPLNANTEASKAYKAEVKRLMKDVFISSGKHAPSGKKYWGLEKPDIKMGAALDDYSGLVEKISARVIKELDIGK